MRGARIPSRAVLTAALLAAALLVSTPASAHWSATGTGVASGSTGTLAAPTGVGVPVNSLPSVPVTWTYPPGSPTPDGYYVTRTSGSGSAAACASSPTVLLSGTSCTDLGVADGAYTYAVTAVFRSWTARSAASGSVGVWTPVRLAVTGQPNNAVAGTAMSPALAVTVQTAAGVAVPIAGRAVTLAIGTNPSGGTLAGTTTATTDATGVATFPDLSINKAGTGYSLVATSEGLTPATSTPFAVTAATADRFAITSAAVSGTASASATLGPITVQRQDPLGNPTAPDVAVTVTLSSSSPGGRFAAVSGGAATSTVTIPAGASSTAFFYGDTTAGSPVITVGGPLAATTQGATITAGTATRFAITSAPISGGTASVSANLGPLTVTRQDSLGNAVTGEALTVALSSSSAGPVYFAATLHGTPSSTITIPSGQSSATFYYGDTKPGTPTITASGPLLSATQAQSIVVGPAALLAITSGSIAGVASDVAARGPVVVQVRDIAGNPVTSGAVLTLSSTSAGTAIFSPTANGSITAPTLTIPSGSSSGAFYYGDTQATGAGTVTVTAAGPGLISATLSGAITPAAPTQLVFGQQPTDTTKSATITPAVTARILDRFGNLTTSTASVSIAIDSNGGSGLLGLGAGTLNGTKTVNAVAGTATFSTLRIDGGALNVGGEGPGYTLKVTGSGLTPKVSNPFNIT